MKKGSVWLMALLAAAGWFLSSCADDTTGKPEKGVIEEKSDETAKAISDKILAPIEGAKEVKTLEENRLKNLQDAAQKEASGK
jgi:hypothetical protein